MKGNKKWSILVWMLLTAMLTTGCFVAQEEELPQPEPSQTLPAETIPATESAPETEPPETVPEVTRLRYSRVPHYFQTDYPYYKLGNGTIASSGCSLTCLAMVASYLTDHAYLPDEMAFHFGDYGKNYVERLEYGSSQLQLPFEKIFGWQKVRRALEEGKVAIVMVNERSRFTTEQHFLVVAGLNEAGKVLVNDPAGYNYLDPYLAYGFENGFEDYDLTNGFSGAWIYDKTAMPEEPFLYDARIPEQAPTRYHGYNLPQEDIDTLACFACAAAGKQSQQVQQAVLETILNRMVSPIYPNTVDKVIYNSELRGYRYAMASANPDDEAYRAVNAAMYGPNILPLDVVNFVPGTAGGKTWGMVEGYTFLYDE